MRSMRMNETRAITRSLAVIGLAASLSVGLGCGSDTTGPAADSIKDGYWALQLNHHAITLSLTAPSNQLQLQAAPLTVRGDTIHTTNRVQYSSNDSSVLVDSTGRLTARLANTGVTVVARLAITNEQGQPVTLADTAIVNVSAASAPTPVFTALRITTPGDSATFSPVVGMTGFTVNVLDGSDTMPTDANSYNAFCRSSDQNVVNYGRGKVNDFRLSAYAHHPGTTTIACDATIYGVTLVDSIPIRVGMPLYGLITVDTQPVATGIPPVVVSTAVIKIGVGGIIQWDNRSKRQVDLVFDDSTAPRSVPASERTAGSGILGGQCVVVKRCQLPTGAGNVLLPPANFKLFNDGVGRDFRKFIAVGAYSYHSTAFPTVTGTIIVQ